MSTINSYGLNVVAPYVLVLQLLVAVLVFWVGGWQWFTKCLVALPVIWILSVMLILDTASRVVRDYGSCH
jgi:hypothetical protein